MSDNLPAKRRRLVDLTPEERVDVGFKAHQSLIKGKSKEKTAFELDVTVYALNKMLEQYAAFRSRTRSDTKGISEDRYAALIEKAWEIIDNPDGYAALVHAKAFEVIIQAGTRIDKLGGHEAPTHNINTKGETVMDMIRREYGNNGNSEGVSPMDGAMLGSVEAEEEIMEAEIVEEEELY